MASSSRDGLFTAFPTNWKLDRDWRYKFPRPMPVLDQKCSSLCWDFSFSYLVAILSYMETKVEMVVSNNELHDWLPFVQSTLFTEIRLPTYNVPPKIWPVYDKCHTSGGFMLCVFRYLRCYGIHKEGAYADELSHRNNLYHSVHKFQKMRCKTKLQETNQRISALSFRILFAFNNKAKALNMVRFKRPALGNLFASEEFMKYNGSTNLSATWPIDPVTGKPGRANHMVLIIGCGTVDDIECYLIQNFWGESWGVKGYAMVPVDLFQEIGYPKNFYYMEPPFAVEDDLNETVVFNKNFGY